MATENNVFEVILFKNGNSQIKERDAMTLSFVSEVYDDENRYYSLQADYGTLLKERGLSLPQFLAINASELELRGQKKIDDETTIEKHIGWICWHPTEPEARQWVTEKSSSLSKIPNTPPAN